MSPDAIWTGPFPAEHAPSGRLLAPGDEAEVTEADLESGHWREKGTSGGETREQLNDRARASGVENPEALGNKQAVLDAIRDAASGGDS